jgi:hypothetical protein
MLGLSPALAVWRNVMRISLLVLLVLCSAALGGVKTVRVPDGGIAPQAAVDAKGVVHLIFFKGDAKAGDIFYTTSTDGGATFAKSVRVNSEPNSSLAAGTIRGPHLALGRNGRPHVAWMGSHPAKPKAPGNQTPMLYTRLGDDGSFEPQRNVIAKQVGMDGGGSVAADEDGNVYVAWHAPETKDGNEADRRLWVARSNDDGKTWQPEVVASEPGTGACACCSVRVIAGRNGLVMATYRRAQNATDRGTTLVVSTNAGRDFKSVKVDDMKSGKCIMSSYAFAPAGEGYLLAFENNGQLLTQRLDARGAPAGKPKPLAAGKHASVAAVGDGDVLSAWAEGAGWNKGGTLKWAKVGPGGEEAGTADAIPAWSVPAALALPGGEFVIVY